MTRPTTTNGVTCGCGFHADTGDASRDGWTYEDHLDVCPNRPPRAPRSWIGDIANAVFSGWGFAVILVVALLIEDLVWKVS